MLAIFGSEAEKFQKVATLVRGKNDIFYYNNSTLSFFQTQRHKDFNDII